MTFPASAALRDVSRRTSVKLHDIPTVVASGSGTEPSLDDLDVARAVLAEIRRSVLGGPSPRTSPIDNSSPDSCLTGGTALTPSPACGWGSDVERAYPNSQPTNRNC
jgi:hypothetical protein